MQLLRRDPEFLFFAAMVGLALLISAPFTFGIVAPFHQAGAPYSAGWWYGGILSVGLVVLLEAGAVGSRVAGVVWLSRVLLFLTFVANYVTGSSYWARATLDTMPALAAWRASGLGWLAPVLYAASVPVLLDVFMGHALKRARVVLSGAPRTVEGEVAELRRDVRALAGYLRETLPALPEQANYPRPELIDAAGMQASVTPEKPVRLYACPVCGQRLSQGQYGAAKRHGRCKSCPPGHQDGLYAG